MSSPPAQTWRSPMEDFLATVLPRSADTGGSSPKPFCAPQILLFSEKFVSNVWLKLKSFPHKIYFAPQTSKSGYEPGSAKIVSAIRLFCFEVHSASRCGIT